MKTEMKVGVVLVAINSLLAHLLPLPPFVSGLLIGLAVYFITIGILPEKAYLKFKAMQAEKFSKIRKIVGVN
ncbi:MAG: hypothetical protein WCS11_00155 [Dysgonamonadaceae bacterium]|jgi:hypothetical protein|nr:hypothetical protein [Dysgonamonadaceae bacterium]MDD3728330.1 hypothetical protein [Dysgonamonadaceae bacterium]HUI32825.1 hypothetical protein [Dysgonamonadaceae bacterium]